MTIEEAAPNLIKIVGKFCKENIGFVKYFDSLEDMHSECLYHCIRRFHKYDPERGALSTWAFLVCRWWSLYKRKKYNWRHSKIVISSLDESISNDFEKPFSDFLVNDERDIDKEQYDAKLLKTLKDNMCEELKDYLKGINIIEQAKKKGVTKQCINNKIYTNRQHLRKVLEEVKNNKYGILVNKADLVHEVMKILNIPERTAYRRVNKYIKTGKCEEVIKSVFKNKIIVGRLRRK